MTARNTLILFMVGSTVFISLTAATATTATTVAAAQTPATTNSQTKEKKTPAPAPAATASDPVGITTTTAAATDASCGCESPTPDVLAIVNGVKLTIKDIDTADNQLEGQRRKLEDQVVESRKRALDQLINSKLLDAEARRRGITTVKLFEQEIAAKAAEPTESDAQAFYDQNRGRIQSEFDEVKDEIISHLRTQRQEEETVKFAGRLRATVPVKMHVDEITPPAAAADRARVIATVSDQKITSGDVEDTLQPLIFNVREAVYKNRKQALDTKINNILLEQEAQKRQLPPRDLYNAEVTAKTRSVTDADAQTFYNQNKERINGDFAQIKPQLMQYLQELENNRVVAAFVEQLRRGASIQTFLSSPEQPVYNIAIDDQPVKGNPSAAVTVVEFTDLQCPACAQTQPVIEKLAGEYGDRVKLVVRDYPLKQHADAFKAAEAAEAARAQGKYWEYVALLFGNQAALGIDKLKEYATRLGLDRRQFDAALDSGRFADKVQRDIRDGDRAGVNATPTIFVNGRRVISNSYETIKASIEEALKAPNAKK